MASTLGAFHCNTGFHPAVPSSSRCNEASRAPARLGLLSGLRHGRGRCSPVVPKTGHRALTRAELSQTLGGAGSEGRDQPEPGTKIKVSTSVKVYHIPKVPEFDLNGQEGVLKDVLGTWKGVPVSANLPYKVQFDLTIDGQPAKFFAHLKDGEFEVL